MAQPERRPIRFDTHPSRFPKVRVVGRVASPFEDIYHFIMTRSWPAFFTLAGVAYLAINALFAFAYMVRPGCIAGVRAWSFEDAFFFSVQTLGTIGYGVMSPATRYGHIMVTLESIAGLLTTALITGITFARFAVPRAKILFSKHAVVAERDGVPHLMFRMANWRHNQILEAQLRVIVLITERTREGHEIRRPVELQLVRDRTAMFGLTWVVMHRIDEKSLFYGPDAIERLRGLGAEMYLSLTGVDETIGQTIHARHTYALEDIVWNALFVDVLSIPETNGDRVIDYAAFHEVKKLEPTRASGDGSTAPSAESRRT